MSGRSRIFRGVLCGAVVLTAFWAFAGSDDGEPAPRFRAKTITGETFTNESVKGKVVLLQFWTTWCPYCRGEQDLVDDLRQELPTRAWWCSPST